jgi:hypothetical protein
MKYARRFGIALACTFAFFAGISGYRAIVQIYRVEVHGPDTLRVGSVLYLDITTSGRVTSSGTLEMVQGTRRDTLGWFRIPDNHVGTFISQSLNPLPVRDSFPILVSAAILADFDAGPAVLRATGTGAKQWMRLPPPTIRERPVVLLKD